MPGPGPAQFGVESLPARTDGLTGFLVRFPSGAVTLCAVGPGALAQAPQLCAEAGLSGTAGYLCDAQLLLCQKSRLAPLQDRLGPLLARPVRELHKALAEVEAMAELLANRGLGRDGFVFAAGGGVLTDLAGLAAALYQRGIPWAAAPSTLLSQVDAGLGGKTGANLRAGKNLVGAFHQPRLVVCDPELLSTLPARERWSGLAEIVKCALIDPLRLCGGEDGTLLSACERSLEAAAAGDPAATAPLVAAALRLKAEVVCADEREEDGARPSAPEEPPGGRRLLRAVLNLGHTVGHALEQATGYTRFTHGEGVALGLRSAIALSRARGLYTPAAADRALALVRRLAVEPPARLAPEERALALAALARDKKAREGRVRFVLPQSEGLPVLTVVSTEEQSAALDAALSSP